MHPILLIWDSTSSLKIYQLYVDYEEKEKIVKCNGKYINVDESEELDWLNEWLPSQSRGLRFESGMIKPFLPILSESILIVSGFTE